MGGSAPARAESATAEIFGIIRQSLIDLRIGLPAPSGSGGRTTRFANDSVARRTETRRHGRVTLEPWWYPVLFGTGLAAGLVDSIAGGGGLLTVPVLLSTGLPPVAALGTNKFQSSFGSGTATWHYVRGGAVKLSDCGTGIVATLVGAALGAWAVQQLPRGVLATIIPFLLAAILIYMIARPQLGDAARPARVSANLGFGAAGLVLGFYDGFFGPGTGSFWTVAIVLLLGWPLLAATGATKVMNFTSNIVSLAVFAVGGHVDYTIGLVMAVGQAIGARLGSSLALRNGAKIIRPVFLVVVGLTLVKLTVDLVRH